MKPSRKLSASSASARLLSRSAEETRALGERFGRSAKAGDVFLLTGPMGAGKTTFVQGFAKGAGFKGRVASPTFGLAREYKARRLSVHHLDLFRLGGRDLPNLGLEEYWTDPEGVCVIEWPELVRGAVPEGAVKIRFSHAAGGARRIFWKYNLT